jgi:hypothetical protein
LISNHADGGVETIDESFATDIVASERLIHAQMRVPRVIASTPWQGYIGLVRVISLFETLNLREPGNP